jgi:hypothetical protein
MAFTKGLIAAMRAMQASSNSTGEISRLPISRRSSTADWPPACRWPSSSIRLDLGALGDGTFAAAPR